MEILGEKASISADFARVHIGAAELSLRRAEAARSPVARARAYERAALQFRKAQFELAKAEHAAIGRTRELAAAVREGKG